MKIFWEVLSQESQFPAAGDAFRLETDCRNCICTITTSHPIDIGDELNSFQVNTFRLNFTNENMKETISILKKYERILINGNQGFSSNINIYDKSVL